MGGSRELWTHFHRFQDRSKRGRLISSLSQTKQQGRQARFSFAARWKASNSNSYSWRITNISLQQKQENWYLLIHSPWSSLPFDEGRTRISLLNQQLTIRELNVSLLSLSLVRRNIRVSLNKALTHPAMKIRTETSGAASRFFLNKITHIANTTKCVWITRQAEWAHIGFVGFWHRRSVRITLKASYTHAKLFRHTGDSGALNERRCCFKSDMKADCRAIPFALRVFVVRNMGFWKIRRLWRGEHARFLRGEEIFP